jgi:hypothetical protein
VGELKEGRKRKKEGQKRKRVELHVTTKCCREEELRRKGLREKFWVKREGQVPSINKML